MNTITAEWGRLVKWLGDDGGWHTGRLVLFSGAEVLQEGYQLVQPSCAGLPSLVAVGVIQEWEPRATWEELANNLRGNGLPIPSHP